MDPLGPRSKAVRQSVRYAYLAAGLLAVVLGGIGILVPGMPSTVFFILALGAFKKSSSRLENWLLTNRVTGPGLREWDRNRSVPRHVKWVACLSICFFVPVSVLVIKAFAIKLIVGALGLYGIYFILTRPTAQPVPVATRRAA